METKTRRLRGWLIGISGLAIVLFLVDAVLVFSMISASVDHLKTGSKSISAGGDLVVLYSVDDFHNDLEIEILASLISMVVLAAGPVGGGCCEIGNRGSRLRSACCWWWFRWL